MMTLNDGRNELWQWDTGRKLTVDAECSQVHFSNKVFGRSVDVDVVDGVAVIPDILLQSEKDFVAWAFVGTAENGYTKISKTFKVNRRNKPADYVFTPPDQNSIEEIKERLENLESIQDPDAIKNAVEDYLDNNPIHIEEADPTVPAWAKQNEKPSYTAAEVGAQPKALVVTISESDAEGYIASHSSSEIAAHVENGGDATIIFNDVAYRNDGGNSEEWYFVSMIADDFGHIETAYIVIYYDKTVQQTILSTADGIPVASVNGKTGAVNLTAADVGALPVGTTIPTDDHINQLINSALGVIENGTY